MEPIALTFDDGPHPEWTPLIASTLRDRSIRATFFVWGEQVCKHEAIVADLLDAGHSVQPHCWQHKSHFNLSASEVEDDIGRLLTLLRALGCPDPHLWRPPWGHLKTGVTRAMAQTFGLELAGWTIDTLDWTGHDASKMLAIVQAEIAATSHEVPVILLHDSFLEPAQTAFRASCAETVELLRELTSDDDLPFAPLSKGLDAALDERPGPPRPRHHAAQIRRALSRPWRQLPL